MDLRLCWSTLAKISHQHSSCHWSCYLTEFESSLSSLKIHLFCFVFCRSQTGDSNGAYDTTHESITLLADVIAILADWERDVPFQKPKNKYSNSANYQGCPYQFYIWASGKWLHSKSIDAVNSLWNEARPGYHCYLSPTCSYSNWYHSDASDPWVSLLT